MCRQNPCDSAIDREALAAISYVGHNVRRLVLQVCFFLLYRPSHLRETIIKHFNMVVSALIGQPPLTEDDYYIVKGILRLFGLPLDPAKGILIPPARPPNYHYETDTSRIIGVLVLCVVVVTTVTVARLLIRALKHGLIWGWDDWVMMLALVGMLALKTRVM